MTGRIVRLDEGLDDLLAQDAQLEIVASGFEWSEGPVWLPDSKCLLFSDIPRNKIMRWSESDGLDTFLENAGLDPGGQVPGREPGSNGLTLDANGCLVVCQHGNRRLIRIEKDNSQAVIADRFEGKKFNSPNDLVIHSSGDIYFTDPPYGLPKGAKDPNRETDWFGVYRVDVEDGAVSLLSREFVRPNGIALSPDESTLYVAQSHGPAAIIKSFDITADGGIENGRTLFDMTKWMGKEKGAPDGMTVDVQGNLWATGPGGVWVITSEGKPLGKIMTGQATSNCTFGDDGSTLYITADMHLMRIKTLTRGSSFAEVE